MESQPSRDQELEDVVDELEDGVADERRAAGAPGNVTERKQAQHAPREGSDQEPPD